MLVYEPKIEFLDQTTSELGITGLVTVDLSAKPDLNTVWKKMRVRRISKRKYKLKGGYKIRNTGEADVTEFSYAVYQSDDAVYDSRDKLLQERLSVGLASGEQSEARLNMTTSKPMRGFLILVLDPFDESAEQDESNNTSTAKIKYRT